MTGSSKALKVAAAAVAVVYCLRKPTSFVPPATRHTAAVVVPAVAAAGAATPAFADAIGDAAKKLSADAYPFMKEVNWNSYTFLTKPGSASAADWAKAVDKMIVMGATMDPELLKKGAMAHHKAIGAVTEANPVMSQADFEAINAAIGRLIASVPESQTMDVYNSIASLVPAEVPPYLMSTVKEADAKKAYEAFLTFKDVVKANPITPQVKDTPAALSGKLGAIDAAAAKLSDASYPFIKSAPWDSDIYLKPLPGVSPNAAMKAIDKAIVMGATMDGKLLRDAAMAHHNALQNMDSKLVTTKADYTAVNAGIGKLIASVPSSQVMDLFNAFSKITGPNVPNNMFSMSSPSEATAAYDAFLQFKDVVKAAQR
jgi:hypothetical protein